MNWQSYNHRWEMYDEDGFDWSANPNNKNKNMNGIGTLSWINVKSALVFGVIVGIGAIIVYTFKVGDIFKLDWHTLVNSFYFGFAGVFLSLVKSLITTNSGSVGGVQVVDKSV